jgi:dynein assembly factor 5
MNNDFERFSQTYIRDINRIAENDRNTRKRGLQNLFESLPWTEKNKNSWVQQLVNSILLTPLLSTLKDSVEKCRELTLNILNKVVDNDLIISSNNFEILIQSLVSRINQNPFPEPAEEIRLMNLELIFKMLQKNHYKNLFTAALIDLLIQMSSKSLLDNFPNSKRLSSQIICLLTEKYPFLIRRSTKQLLKSLLGNIQHQHSKTRQLTVRVRSAYFSEPNH